MTSPRIHFIGALLAGVLALTGYGFWYGVISEKSNEAIDLQNKITETSEAMSRIAATRAALVEISGDEAKVQNYFVPETDASAFIDAIEAYGLSQKAGVSVLSASVGGSSTEPALILPVTVTGTFDAVLRTVGAIEYAPYVISISTLSIQKNGNGAWQANLTLVVSSVPKTVAKNTP